MGLFLGNRLVSPAELIKEGGSSSKFGVSMDNIIGNVTNGVLGSPSTINGITFTGVTEIADNALSYFMCNKNVNGAVSFPSLTTISAYGMRFAFGTSSVTGVLDLSALTTVGYYGMGNAFESNSITSVDLSALTTIGDYGMFYAFSYNQITSISFPSLTTIGDYGMNGAFYSSNQITSISFPSLTTIGEYGLGDAFSYMTDPNTGLTTLQSVSFPALTSNSFAENDTTAFNSMLSDNDGVTVHFPSNLQSVIGDWDDVKNGFGGTNTTVLFDLPATE